MKSASVLNTNSRPPSFRHGSNIIGQGKLRETSQIRQPALAVDSMWTELTQWEVYESFAVLSMSLIPKW